MKKRDQKQKRCATYVCHTFQNMKDELSSTTSKRPGLQKLLEDVKMDLIGVVAVTDMTRTARRV